MRRMSPRFLSVAALCLALSACAINEPPTTPQPSSPAPTITVATATPSATPTPRFVTATPTPVVVPSLPVGCYRIVSPRFMHLADTETISDYSDPKSGEFLRANMSINRPPFQPPQTLCEESETPHIAGASSFITPNTGWMMCGLFAQRQFQIKQLYKTEDGAVHWTLINETSPGSLGGRVPTTLPRAGTIGSLFFLDDLHGWLSVDQDSSEVVVEENSLHSGIFATDDGGGSWRPVFATNGQSRITGIAFKSPTEGYLADLDPLTRLEIVLSTHDAGTTWTQIYPSLVPNNAWHFFDAQHAIGAGTLLDPAAILTTEDSGISWRQVGSLRDGNDGSVIRSNFPDLLHGWVIVQYDAGQGRTYALSRTIDGGTTWTTLSPGRVGFDYAAYYVSFQDARNGYVSTVDGRISVTHDGGDAFQATNTDGSRASPVPGIRAQTGMPTMQFPVYILNRFRDRFRTRVGADT